LSDPEPPAPLAAVIAERIRAEGPIPVGEFMALALGHPEHGYYRSREPFGKGGDFITAPEVCQAFGELLGLCLAQAWLDQGRPDPFLLVELGPGRGQLMVDLLRATGAVPGFRAAAKLHLVETSARLIEVQRQKLAAAGIDPASIAWHARFEDLPAGPLFLIANELFDALPVDQFIRTAEGGRTAAGWQERRVGLDPTGAFSFVAVDAAPDLMRDLALPEAAPGAITEISRARAALAGRIGARLAADGGLALVIDYGAWPSGPTGDTLQAVRGQKSVPPLAAPGMADLSTQVDFKALGEAASAAGAAVFGPVPQGPFLRALGIEARIAALLQATDDPEARRALRAGLFRLTDAGAMGELFKVLILGAPGAPLPPGFSAPTLQPATAPDDSA
jgi:SAM-dependent MidA family methyltransferase